MRIMITGGTGFIGKNLIRRLQHDNELHILVRPNSHYAELGVEHLYVMDTKEDIDARNLSYYLKTNKIDGIIHLASLYIAEHKSDDIKGIILSNVYLGTALLEACKLAGTKWFLNTGTIWQNYNVPDKSDEYNPVNLYAASKQAFMTMARYYTDTSDLRFCTLKLCDTYGPNDTRRKILALFMDISEGKKHLDMSPGEQCIDLLHIDDVVEGFARLAEMLNGGGALLSEYVLTSGHQVRLRDLAREYEKAYNVKLDITWGGRPYRLREVMRPYKGNVLPGWKPKRLSL